MDVRRPGAVILLTLLLPAAAPAAALLPVAVKDGRAECVLSTEQPGEQYLLVVGSLARTLTPQRVTVTAAPTADPEALPLDPCAADPRWRAEVQRLAERQATARQRPSAGLFVPAQEPPRRKTFHLFVKDGSLHDPAGYVAVEAELRGVGRYCQVYVDAGHADARALQPTVDDVIRTFDEEVYPQAPGQALDTDRDGRFTILLSGWLAKLQGGKARVSGFVRGSDFLRDLDAPYGNRCDMLYLGADLKPGPFLRTVVAHEYTHGVVFSEHVFGDYLAGAARQDEEGWLNEALSHLAEDRHGYSWANLDYRVSAYLNAPERCALVVPDYYGSKLWRDPASRGCTYLFLRWCVDRFGLELLTRLVRSNLAGVANLEAATQTPLAELFRHWSAAQALAGRGVDLDGVAPLRGVAVRGRLGSRWLGGPRFHEVTLGGGRAELAVNGTAAGYVLLHTPAGTRTRLTVTADPKAELQVSVVRLPRLLARLELRGAAAEGGIRLTLTAHHAAVRLEEVLWERAVTHEEPAGDSSYTPDAPGDGVRRWFGAAGLKAGETRTSAVIRLPAGVRAEEVVFRVTGVDDAGHGVSAWWRRGER
jgi:hypothetical protein